MSHDVAPVAEQPPTATSPPPKRAGWRGRAFDPLLTYLAISVVAGTILCFVLPLFAGNDEATHFIRAYQVSTGKLVPVNAPPHTVAGTGACVPLWLAFDFETQRLVAVARGNDFGSSTAPASNVPPGVPPTLAEQRQFVENLMAPLPHCGPKGAQHRFIDTSTFAWYSPLTYLPPAAAISAGRAFGWNSVGLDRAGRLAQLAVVIFLIALAIQRAPWGKWIFAIVASTPLALVVSATIRPDAITSGLALLVIASALRIVDAGGFTRHTLVDALVWSALLGLSKPTYWIVAGMFLALLVGRYWRERGVIGALRHGGWQAVVPVALSAAASAVWQSGTRNRFICDIRFFGVTVDTRESVHQILTSPDHFVANLVRVVRDSCGPWLRETVQVDARITGAQWPVATITVILVAFLVLALRPTVDADGEPRGPRPADRVLAVVLAVALLVALAVGFAVYCSSPGSINALFFTARFLVPLFVLVLLAAAPTRRVGRLLARQPVPPALALGAFYAGYLIVVSHAVV